jgi:hypothetical protein
MFNDDLPPEILYSYSSIGAWLPACLAGKSLKFSSRSDFNDPFDSRPAYQIDAGAVGQRYIKEKLKAAPGLSPAKRLLIQQQVRNKTLVPRQFGDLVTDELLDSVGILCLTEEWDEPLFWGHYAAKHAGICIGFYTDCDVFRLAHRIMYQQDLPVILRPQDSNEDMVRKAFLTKSVAWQQEKEWRIIKHKVPEGIRKEQRKIMLGKNLSPDDARILGDQRGAAIYEFDPSAIASLTLGMNISPENEKFVVRAVKESNLKMTLYRAKKHHIKYKIERELMRVR